MLKMIAIEGRVAGIALNLAYFGNELSISYDEFIRHSVSVPFKILGVSKERIEEIIEESEFKFRELDFKLKPYFEFE